MSFIYRVRSSAIPSARGLVSALVFTALVWSASACSTTSVAARLHLPPRAQAMQAPQSVQIMGFGGPRGTQSTQVLRSAISAGKLHRVVDSNLDATRYANMEKLLASGSHAALSGSASEGATVLLWGSTGEDAYEAEIDEREVERCVKKSKDGKCTKQVKIKVYTLSEECAAEVTGRATNVANGAILVERTASGHSSTSRSQENKPPSSMRTNLCNTAFSNAMNDLVPFFTDYTTTVSLKFQKLDDDGATERALDLVKLSKLTDAESILEKVISNSKLEEEDRARARMNLSVVYWAQGAFDKCIEQLDIAQTALGSDGDLSDLYKQCREYVQ